MDFVLVHIGEDLPNYIVSNLDHLSSLGFDVHFVCNKTNISHITNAVKCTDIESFDLLNTGYRVNKTGNINHDEFLTKTSLRFFVLSEYAKQNNLKNFFHIENDVFILDSDCITKTSKFLIESCYHTSLVMDCDHRCVPSILWFRSSQKCSDLWSFVSKENKKTDMELLSDYFYANKDCVINFPIVPPGYQKDNSSIDYSSFFNEVDCVFDGAAIGQYLYGIDDGNGGKNSKGFVNETSMLKPCDLSFVKKEEGRLTSSFKNENFSIANIHMHCKRNYKYSL